MTTTTDSREKMQNNYRAIVHKIDTEQFFEDCEVTLRDAPLPPDQTVTNLLSEILKLYNRRIGKGLGVFNKNQDLSRFSVRLTEYLQHPDDDSFTVFTRHAMSLLKAQMEKQELSTGGYVVFAHIGTNNGTKRILAAMLRDKVGSAIDDDLNVTQRIHLDLDKLHVCCEVKIDGWIKNEGQYLSFIKGQASNSTPKYFLDFVGCDEFSDAKTQTEELHRAAKDYSAKHIPREDRVNFYRKITKYCEEKLHENKAVFLDDLSRHLNEELPLHFLEFINEHDYKISTGFEPNKNSLKKFKWIGGQNDSMSLRFEARLLTSKKVLLKKGNSTLRLNDDALVIFNPPQKIVDQIDEINREET
ncbi:nucleoid-associated protein [Halodesulfovibrio sp.]|jgi:nucleoid-associated protein|uniref:nucleoid-associated protein n=1 Tax=Halodesulfovibrio sp. TaxID=1912772 RepID=UPI0025F3B073|nr:nucleoid-associated protein [Halodesulfovibrio sp.]MCT4627035.1 nucleoid-associated protein [Halodesulfovibrio sp.]